MPTRDPARRKEQTRQAQARYFTKNPAAQRERVRGQKAKVRAALLTFKRTLRCERCGESHPACLEFHHHDSESKDANVADMVKSGLCIERIMVEIQKCTVLCANCHRKEHWAADGSKIAP